MVLKHFHLNSYDDNLILYDVTNVYAEGDVKYRTDKMIDGLKGRADKHDIYIGLTHRDICREQKNGVKDWGVVGSSIAAYHANRIFTKYLSNCPHAPAA